MFFNIFKKDISNDKVISIKLQEELLNEFDMLVENNSTNRNRVIKELMKLYVDKKVKFNFVDIEEKHNYDFNNNLNNLILGSIGKGKNLILKHITKDLINSKKIIYMGESEKEIGLLAFSDLYDKKIYDYDKDGINIKPKEMVYLINNISLDEFGNENKYFNVLSQNILNDLIYLLDSISIEINIENIEFYLNKDNFIDLNNKYTNIKGFDLYLFESFVSNYLDKDNTQIEYCKIIINKILDKINFKIGNKNISNILEEYDVFLLRNSNLLSLIQNLLENDLTLNLNNKQYIERYSNLHLILDNVNVLSNEYIRFIRFSRKYVINWSIFLKEFNIDLYNFLSSMSYINTNLVLLQNNVDTINRLREYYKKLDFDNFNILLNNLKLDEYYIFNIQNETIYKYKNIFN